ncbi:hypothetical protein [Gemmatimonas sp.]|uniref:hypothetical protein n=1 Tax=Gemmatimonas sp. TaxID=1962908 RepID=UPI003562FA0E
MTADRLFDALSAPLTVIADPLAAALADVRVGVSMTEAGRRHGLTESRVRRALAKAAADPTAAAMPVVKPVTVTGGWKDKDNATFTWSNVSDIPDDANIRDIITTTGGNPDHFEWFAYHVDWQFIEIENDSTWQRDHDISIAMAGVKGTAYTGPSHATRRTGTVKIRIEKRAVVVPTDLETLATVADRLPGYQCMTCGARFLTSRVGTVWCSAKCKNTRPSTENDFGIVRHVIIPDTQVKPGDPTDHLVWAGRMARENCAGKRTKFMVIGDWWDMPSLSHWDAGKMESEGRRVKDDLDAGNRAFEVFAEALGTDPLWSFHFFFGNHEERIMKYVSANPAMAGFLSLDNCVTPPGWERHSFLDVAVIDGIAYSHYFYQPNTGKPYGGAIDARIKLIGRSFVMGHQQGLALGTVYAGGERRGGVVAGSFYQHDEGYKGPQGNDHFRGIVFLNDVENGSFDAMPVSMDYLCRRYEGHRYADHVGRVL